MKQGSTDDPFAEDPEGPDERDATDETGEQTDDDGRGTRAAATRDDANGRGGTGTDGSSDREEPATAKPTAEPDTAGVTAGGESAAEAQAVERRLPYIHARDGVKDGRTQRPVFLREDIEAGIDELVAQMEAEFGGDVYKTDVTEAAMAVAEEYPDLVRAKLEEWGYGWT